MSTASKKFALLIGVNYYNYPDCSLRGCVNDVVNMCNVLVDAYDYDRTNIIVLRDDANDSAFLPTRANIIDRLKWLITQSATASEIWIHYSGHGSQIRDQNGDEADGRDEIILPCDFRSAGIIGDDELQSALLMVRSPTVCIFDCCNSATVCDLPWSFQPTSATAFQRIQNYKTVFANKKIYCISGCRDEQTSADAYNAESKLAMGALTMGVIQAMRWNRHCAQLMKIYVDVLMFMRQNGFDQVPVFSSSTDSPDYVLSRAVVSRTNTGVYNQANTGYNGNISASKKSVDIVGHKVVTTWNSNIAMGINKTYKENKTMIMKFI